MCGDIFIFFHLKTDIEKKICVMSVPSLVHYLTAIFDHL